MALVPISQSQVSIPDSRGLEVGVPVSSGVLGGIADALNHDVGWRQLRQANFIIGRRHDYTNGTITEDPGGKGTQQFPLVFPTSDRAEYLQILITYQARKPSLVSPDVGVWLSTLAGATVDGTSLSPAFRWSYDDGTLSTARSFTGGYTGPGIPIYKYPVLHANTGIDVDDTPTTPTTPRCLNLTTFAGTALVVWFEERECRLLTVSIRELYKELVDQ